MNRIQLVGRIDKKKHKIELGSKCWAELLLPPSSDEMSDIADGQFVQVIGDMWSHPAQDKPKACIIRAAIINSFPGDKDVWASGTITINNPVWAHDRLFSTPSFVGGTTKEKDYLWIKMPLVESRWAKKVGGLIRPFGSVDLQVTITGSSNLECVVLVSDKTSTGAKAGATQALPNCEALDWFDKQQREFVVGSGKRRRMSPKMRRDVFLRDGFKCQECGASPGKDRLVWLEVDHVVPVAKGGTDEPSNLRTLCNHCNAGKSTEPAYSYSLTP
jgi:hypothetical protein